MTRSPLVQISVTDHVCRDVTLAKPCERNTRALGNDSKYTRLDEAIQESAERKVGKKGMKEV